MPAKQYDQHLSNAALVNSGEYYAQALQPASFRRVAGPAPMESLKQLVWDAQGEWVVIDCADQTELAQAIRRRLQNVALDRVIESRCAGDVVLARWRIEQYQYCDTPAAPAAPTAPATVDDGTMNTHKLIQILTRPRAA